MTERRQVSPAPADFESGLPASSASGVLGQLGHNFENVEPQDTADDDVIQVVMMTIALIISRRLS